MSSKQNKAKRSVPALPKKKKGRKNRQNRGGSSPRVSSQGGGRVNITSLQSNPLFGGRLTSNSDSMPSAFVNIMGNTTYYNEEHSVMKPELGFCPVNITGSQPFSDVTGAVATPDVFTSATLATTNGANYIYLSPDILNGPIAAKANLYTQYVFRDILIEYVSTCATTQANGIALGFDPSPDATTATTFSTARQLVPSIMFPLRADRAYLHFHYFGPTLWYCLVDTATDVGLRQTVQGYLIAFSSANLTVIKPGFFNIYYSVDLYNPVPSQGFTLAVRSKDDRDLLRKLIMLCEKEKINIEDFLGNKGIRSLLNLNKVST